MSGWRWNPKVAAVITAAVVVFQLVGPTLGVFGERSHPGRFGWQMFSLSSGATLYTVHTPSGAEDVDVGRYLAVPRSDLPLEELIPPHLCQVFDDAQRITWDGGELEC